MSRESGADGRTRPGRRPAVLRISHSSVVTAWRARDRGLRDQGVDVTLLSAARWDEGGAPVAFDAAGDAFASPVRTIGRHPNLFLYDPRPLWRLLGRHWDLLDVHEEPFSLAMAEVLALRALRARRVPFVVYSAQNLPKRYPPPFRWSERYCLRHASGAYPCNAAAGEILRTKGLDGEIAVLPLGIDLARFAPAERRPPEGRLTVGYVGRLSEHKGVAVLLEEAARDPRIRVDLCGDGPAAPALRALAGRLGIAGRVTFTGFVDYAALPGVYPTFDVVAVPSVPVPGWVEQFCRVAVEAMASGVPVVASDTGAIPEVVGDGGVLVAPGDPEALARALARLLDEPGHWEALRSAGLAGVGRFDWRAVSTGQRDLYRRAMVAARP